MKTHYFKIRKTVRYYTLGATDNSVEHLWIVLHGYGQLGKFFLRHFSSLKAEGRLIVAPEAPNRFYLANTDGRVGANWMTKEERLRDIDDYCEYLNNLAAHFQKLVSDNCKVHIFGFSQGVATAVRWVNNFEGDNLISLHGWAGTFPPDIDYNLNREKFNALLLTVNFGDEDEFISPQKANVLIEKLQSQNINVKRIDYKGGHKLMQTGLKDLFEMGEGSKSPE